MSNSVNQTNDSNTFFHFLHDYVEQWNYANIHEKDRELHEFLNIECGAGVFTHVMNPTQIKIEHSESKHVLIDVTNDLATVSQQVEAFLNTL